MPTYDYRCTVCGREVEVVHGIYGTGPQTCEACGGAMRKTLSAPAIHFKGSGWAKKDAAASAKNAQSKSAPSKSPPGDTKSDSGKGDGGDAKRAADAKDTAGSGDTKSDKTTTPAPASKAD